LFRGQRRAASQIMAENRNEKNQKKVENFTMIFERIEEELTRKTVGYQLI
jgi:5,10-methylenetetrahydrofolate reductase